VTKTPHYDVADVSRRLAGESVDCVAEYESLLCHMLHNDADFIEVYVLHFDVHICTYAHTHVSQHI
jgi:hypothetical protein